MSTKRVYGIDLGTTYSCIAYVDSAGNPTVIKNSQNESTTASVVHFESASNFIVGTDAKAVASIKKDEVVSRVKRQMGAGDWSFVAHGQTYRPEDVSSLILRKLVNDAAESLGEKIEDVVITVPAYFGINQRKATEQAGQIAGLNVKHIIPEPTAAAIAYGMKNQDADQNILVYDLGGGTFDVTVIAVEKGKITVAATDGDHELGGADWDADVASFLASQFEEQCSTPADQLLGDPETYQQLLLDAEDVKRRLSTGTSVQKKVTFGGAEAKVEVTRDRFNQLTLARLDRTIFLTKKVVESAEKNKHGNAAKGIDKILLVGGSSRMPQVKDRIRQELPGIDVMLQDPDEIVAKGAALFGLKCQIEDIVEGLPPAEKEKAMRQLEADTGTPSDKLNALGDIKVVNVSSKSFGPIALNGQREKKIFNLIFVDQPVPAKTDPETFNTLEDRQTGVKFEICENTSKDADLDPGTWPIIGQVVVEFTEPLPKGSEILVTFTLDEDGLLTATANSPKARKPAYVEIKTAAVRTKEQVQEVMQRLSRAKVS